MKPTLPIVEDVFRMVSLKLGGNGPSLINRFQKLSVEPNVTIHRCHLPEPYYYIRIYFTALYSPPNTLAVHTFLN